MSRRAPANLKLSAVTDKPIVLSRHAQHVVDERKLAEEWIAEAIATPAFSEPDPTQAGAIRAFRRIAAFGNRVLRVVYHDVGTHYRVITVFFDRQASRRRSIP